MKRILLSIVAIATISLNFFGQAPEGFKYQAVVRDAGNTILNNQVVGMQMTIQQGFIGGTTVYQETFTPTTNGYGLINLEIGSGTVISGDFTTIDWSVGPYFIETAVDITGGTSYAVMGTSQLMSVPYALHSKTAESVTNDAVDDADADPTNELQDWSNLPGIPANIDTDATDDFSGDYNDLTNQPTIPTVPTNVSVFTNDAGYVTTSNDADADPTNELQDWSNLPGIPANIDTDATDDFSGDYNDLTNQPTIPTVPTNVSVFTNDAGYVTTSNDADADPTNELQNIGEVLIVGNNANGNNIVNTGKIGIGTAAPNVESSMDIATALPVVFPSMTQVQVDALTAPVAGMVQYNTTANKLQVYSVASGAVANSTVSLTDTYVMDDGFMQDYPAQSFQPSTNTNLQSITFWVNNFYNGFVSGDVTFNVYQGVPNAPVTLLHSSTLNVNSLGAHVIPIPSTPSLVGGTDYYFEIVPVGPFPVGWFSVSRSNGATPGEHASGSLWYNYPFGGGFMMSGVDDLQFEVLGGLETWSDLH